MKIEVLANPEAVAQRAAEFIAAEARAAVAARHRFVLAVSGGHTPWVMLRALSTEDAPWKQMHIVQVDERIAPPVILIAILLIFKRVFSNMRRCRRKIFIPCPSKPATWKLPPNNTPQLADLAGSPPVLDLAQPRHGARWPYRFARSWRPCAYRDECGRCAYRCLYGKAADDSHLSNSSTARVAFLFLVTGKEKVNMLPKLLAAADNSIPSGRIRLDNAVILADRDAAARAAAS